MIQPGFAAISPGGTYGSPTSFGNNNNNVGQNANGLHDGGMNNDGNGQSHNGMGGGGGGVGHDGQPIGGGQPQQQQPEYSLAGILHFLQSEWRRYERDRNEWEIERAEMRARVALLEGERRSVENLKTDLMRRVKMLEFALRHERSKYLASSSSLSSSAVNAASAVAGSAINPKHTALQAQDKASTSSGRSSPAIEPGNTTTGNESGTMGTQRGHSTISSQGFSTINMGTLNGNTQTFGTGIGSTLHQGTLGGSGTSLTRQGSSAKDPKARAKSREYLKQCLQEISYLTSTSTLNPLPERAQVGSVAGPGHLRPRKTMTDNVPSTFTGSNAQQTASNDAQGTAVARRQRSLDKTNSFGARGTHASAARNMLPFSEALEEKEEEEALDGGEEQKSDRVSLGEDGVGTEISSSVDGLALDKDSLASPQGQGDHDGEGSLSEEADPSRASADDFVAAPQLVSEGGEREPITAIYRPDDGGGPDDDWAKLKEAGRIERERRERERLAVGKAVDEHAIKADDEDLAALTLSDTDDEASRVAAEAAADSQMWKSKRVLRGHLDSVRAVVFDSSDLGLYSASDDGTIKYWKIDSSTLKQNKPQTQVTGGDSDPVATLRGHSGAVTSLAIAANKQRLYSGSVDASIVVWKLLDGGKVEPYPPFDKSSEVARLVGHTQPIWDLCVLPTKGDDEGSLASASADGTVKIWSTTDEQGGALGGQLLISFDYFGLDPSAENEAEKEKLLALSGPEDERALPVPTSVSPCMSDLRRIAVSFNNAVVKLFDVQTGKEVMRLASDAHYDGTPASQVNKVITHPTLPILITAHENNYIQFFDMNTGACTLSMVAHLDGVTSLDIDSSGLTLVSGGHDCSVRFWDIVSSNDAITGVATTTDKNATNDVNGGSKNATVCVQEITAHRKKSSEGVLVVKYHPNATWFCSAGADGVIRIYG